ncbi:helix-turn-helix domain-containing protein [Caballeronia sp. LjRoot34]|uniref:helix-turn-helix transcriptional regulator n=1 Tax=Caballeronia sp. LjRoot34 TaxID=3342325 RepID=UPI003ED024F8
MTTAISEAGVDPTVQHFDKMPESAFVDVATVAALLGVSPQTIRRRAAEGEIPAPQDIFGLQRYRVGVVRNVILKSFDLIALDDSAGGFDKPLQEPVNAD